MVKSLCKLDIIQVVDCTLKKTSKDGILQSNKHQQDDALQSIL